MRLLIAAVLSVLPVATAGRPDIVVVARAAHDPLLIWNASPTIYALVAQAAPDPEVNAQLQRGARRIVDAKRAILKNASGTLTVRVVYEANVAAHGTNYSIATMGKATTYAILEMPARGGPERFRVIGKLPR